LAAALAPEGATGRTMAAVTGASTVATAIGPILSSALLGLRMPAGFIALQILFCVAAAAASLRLRRMMRPAISNLAAIAPQQMLRPSVELAA
jgi:predicted MFS family arabinose efflux permease